MTVLLLDEAEQDLDDVFDYYEGQRGGLGLDLLHEFRAAMNRIVAFPFASQRIDDVYRRHKLRRFPYVIVYRIDDSANQIVVACLFHRRRKPGGWRGRE